MSKTETDTDGVTKNEQKIIDLVDWLYCTNMVVDWDLAETYKGVVVRESTSLDPSHIPDGWEIKQISGSEIDIGLEY